MAFGVDVGLGSTDTTLRIGNTRSWVAGLSTADGEYGPTSVARPEGCGALSGGGCELSPAKSWVAVWASAADSGSWSLGRGAGEAWAASPWEAECSASWGCGGGGDMGAYLRVQQRVGCGGLGGGGDGLGRDGDRGPAGGCWALTAQASIDCDDAALQRLQVAQVLGGLAGFVALRCCWAWRYAGHGEYWRVGGGSGAWQLGWMGASERAGSVQVVLECTV